MRQDLNHSFFPVVYIVFSISAVGAVTDVAEDWDSVLFTTATDRSISTGSYWRFAAALVSACSIRDNREEVQ